MLRKLPMSRRMLKAARRKDIAAFTYHVIDHRRRLYRRMAADFERLRVPFAVCEEDARLWPQPRQ